MNADNIAAGFEGEGGGEVAALVGSDDIVAIIDEDD